MVVDECWSDRTLAQHPRLVEHDCGFDGVFDGVGCSQLGEWLLLRSWMFRELEDVWVMEGSSR